MTCLFRPSVVRILSLPLALVLSAGEPLAQRALPDSSRVAAIGDPLSVLGVFRLNDGIDPFERTLGEDDEFGSAIASLGDLDGNGNQEYAIGAPGDFVNHGALWIFSLLPDRSTSSRVKYGPVENLPFTLDVGDRFGAAVTALGDLDGDGIGDIAVGAPGDDDGLVTPFTNAGAIYLLFLGSDGRIRAFEKFSRTAGGFPGLLDAGDAFGSAVSSVGDLDGNGVEDLIVGAPNDDDGGANRGAAWVLFLGPAHTVIATQKISQTQGGFGGVLVDQDHFGSSLALLGDLDGDGRPEVAVGSSDRATLELWVLSLDPDGTVFAEVGSAVPGVDGALGVARLGDLDGDGVTEVGLGDARDGGTNTARVTVAFLFSDGSLKGTSVIDRPANLEDQGFGRALAAPGDTDGNGLAELLVGIPNRSNRARNMGGMLIYNLGADGQPSGPSFLIDADTARVPVAPTRRPASGVFMDFDSDYGRAIASMGDVDGDGFSDVAVGSPGDNDGGRDVGAVWIHHLTPTSGRRADKLSRAFGNLPVPIDSLFGSGLAALGDLDRNGVIDLAVCAPGKGSVASSLWIVFLGPNSRALATRVLTPTDLGFAGNAKFADRILAIGDLDGDDVTDLIVRSGTSSRIVFLAADGSVKASRPSPVSAEAADYGPRPGGGRSLLRIVSTSQIGKFDLDRSGNLVATQTAARSARALTAIGDLDGDGIRDIALLPGGSRPFVRLELLNADLSVKASSTFGAGHNPFALAPLGDVTGDGVPDLAGVAQFGEVGSVFLTALGGIAVADFETRDDADAAPMENGRSVPSASGRRIGITTEGAHLGAAAFDSTRGGANDPSQDGDLLVDSGKILILQDSLHPTQTIPGIFDQPNDDSDGGLVRLEFRRLVKPLSVRLIDIDLGGNEGATVRLFDAAGRSRVYDVPGGFTEDRVTNGGTGWRRLDLTTLMPQAGFQSTAFASETPGFAAGAVVRMEIELGSSGAIDDLVYDPYP